MNIDYLLADLEAQLAAEARDRSLRPTADAQQALASFETLSRLEVHSRLGRTFLEPGIVLRDAALGVNNGQLVVLPLTAVQRVTHAPTLKASVGGAIHFSSILGLGDPPVHGLYLRHILREWLGEQVSLTCSALPREPVMGRLVSASRRILIVRELSGDVLIPLHAVLAVRLCTTSAECWQRR